MILVQLKNASVVLEDGLCVPEATRAHLTAIIGERESDGGRSGCPVSVAQAAAQYVQYSTVCGKVSCLQNPNPNIYVLI